MKHRIGLMLLVGATCVSAHASEGKHFRVETITECVIKKLAK
jgi:hypothetical protein